MKTPHRLLILITALHIIHPSLALRIRNDTTRSRGMTASPTLIYRRRINGARFKESIYPETSPKSYEEQKTDYKPIIDQRSLPNNYADETVEPKHFYPTTRLPRIPKPLRRHRPRQRAALAEESAEQVEYTTKPLKTKTGRRRKVKRPAKIKPVAQKLTDVEPGSDSIKANSSNPESGDKNLALEIGSEDGKYALIDKFFDSKPSAAPGVLSYAPSEDFTKDNHQTLGNVKENDIWLSDGHLLVLKGGDLDASLREHWKPIDNYQRGKRPPLKIALDGNNPAPFPVFVNDSGPPVFIGPLPPFGIPYPPPGAINETFDPSRLPPPGLIPLYPNGTIPDYYGPPPPGFGGGNNSFPLYPGPPPGNYGNGYGQGGFGNGTLPRFPPGPFGNNTLPPPPPFFPFPPTGNRNGSFPPPFYPPPPPGFNPNNFNGGPPRFPILPPLALNPNDNETDDPSIFLPPPYDFDYHDENDTLVPPGPFAPGLVVPPPKDFYTVYNKTKRPILPQPPTGLSYGYGKRPQRPNDKKAKFPMTNPPDDSEEAYKPLVTTPFPFRSETPYKKRKQRPGKANKEFFGQKYESEIDSQKISIVEPTIPSPPQILTHTPLVTISGPSIIKNAIVQTTIPTTPKPLNNYVYVRGQLKSLAELRRQQEQQQQQGEYEYEPTPRPPFDEHGYPTRVIDDNEPVILQYHKKTTEIPTKSFYYNTPKYGNIYTSPKKLKSPNLQNQILNYNLPQNQNQRPVPPSQSSIAVSQEEPPSIYNRNNNNGFSNQGQNQNLFIPINNFQEKIAPTQPTYYQRPNGVPQDQPQIVQLQSPKSYSTSTRQRQPHLYNNDYPNNNQHNLNYQTNSQFRPAFGPTTNSQRSHHSRVLFPGQVSQTGPIFNINTPLYQQQNRPNQGYYSPVSQYYQPLDPNTPVQQGNYYQEQPGGVNQQQQQYVNDGNSQIYQKQPQQQQPFYSNQGQSPGNNQLAHNPYGTHQNQFIPQLQQNIYNNYRETPSQYNTDSEAVTARTVLRAGPSQQNPIGASTNGKSGSVLSKDGSYYSFERGGPGGFSYKIRL